MFICGFVVVAPKKILLDFAKIVTLYYYEKKRLELW